MWFMLPIPICTKLNPYFHPSVNYGFTIFPTISKVTTKGENIQSIKEGHAI